MKRRLESMAAIEGDCHVRVSRDSRGRFGDSGVWGNYHGSLLPVCGRPLGASARLASNQRLAVGRGLRRGRSEARSNETGPGTEARVLAGISLWQVGDGGKLSAPTNFRRKSWWRVWEPTRGSKTKAFGTLLGVEPAVIDRGETWVRGATEVE